MIPEGLDHLAELADEAADYAGPDKPAWARHLRVAGVVARGLATRERLDQELDRWHEAVRRFHVADEAWGDVADCRSAPEELARLAEVKNAASDLAILTRPRLSL